MKRKIISVIATIGFLSFIAVMNYPYVSRMINEMIQGEVVINYQEEVVNMDEIKRQQMFADAEQYNKELAGGRFGIKDITIPNYEEIGERYGELLATGQENIMGIIKIPKIEVSLPIYHGTTSEVLEKGSGHLEGSSLPIGGVNTHTCLTAHRGLPTKKMFTNIDMLEIGDIFYIHILNETLAYKIYDTETVLPDQVEMLAIKEGEDLATLITCTPYGINSHRMFVHGYRIPYEEEKEELKILEKEFWINYWWIPVTILLIAWLIFLLYRFNRQSEQEPSDSEMKK